MSMKTKLNILEVPATDAHCTVVKVGMGEKTVQTDRKQNFKKDFTLNLFHKYL